MDSISRELNLGIQTMASRVRMMHLYYGADGHLLWTSHLSESEHIQALIVLDCCLHSSHFPMHVIQHFFLVPSGLDCAPANSSLLWIWCAHVHRLFFALLVPVAAKVQCQTSTSVVLSSPNGDHHNLCPIVSMSFYLCRLEVPGLHMAASITSACLGHDNS